MTAHSFFGSMYTYPWDLSDEGPEVSLERISNLAGCREVMLASSYHVSNYFLPHHPRHPIYYGENGAIYFQPDLNRYAKTRIHPRISREITGPGYFEDMVNSIRKKGLIFSAWIVYLFQHYLSEKYPEFAKHDAFGTPYYGQLSPSPPDVREYVMALTREIVEKYQPQAVHVEALQRQPWLHGNLKKKIASDISVRCQFLLSLCFNPATIEAADNGDMDAEKFRREVEEWLKVRLARLPTDEDNLPVSDLWIEEAFDGKLKQYMDICRENTTSLWQKVADIIHNAGAQVQFGLIDKNYILNNDLDPVLNRNIDRLTTGSSDTEKEKNRMAELSRKIAPRGKIIIHIGVGKAGDSHLVEEQVKNAVNAGAGGVIFYNYGLLREEQLGFIGKARRIKK